MVWFVLVQVISPTRAWEVGTQTLNLTSIDGKGEKVTKAKLVDEKSMSGKV